MPSKHRSRSARKSGPSKTSVSAAGIESPPLSGGTSLAHVSVEVVPGPIARVKAPVAVIGRYEGMPPGHTLLQFDCLIDRWVSRAIEFGMMGSRLGELFYLPLSRQQEAGKVAPEALIVVGLGEPGRYGRDDLRYVMTNVTLAVKGLGHDEFSTVLIGSRRRELSVENAVRAMLEGVADGLQRFRQTTNWGLNIRLVERQENPGNDLFKALASLKEDDSLRGLDLEVKPWKGKGSNRSAPKGSSAPDLPPQQPMTRITITSSLAHKEAASSAAGSEVLQYSAMAETAVIPVREVAVQSFFAKRLPPKLMTLANQTEQENYGRLLANYLVPKDFRNLIEGGDPLTVVLDARTANFPWEMVAYKSNRTTRFFGTNLKLTRQFRTQFSAAPGMPPPLNETLRVLVIADPAPDVDHLPLARQEGQAVVNILKTVHQKHKERGSPLDLKVTVRIGAYKHRVTKELDELLTELRGSGDVVTSAAPCDPLELLSLIVNEKNEKNEEWDIIHYAGHSVFEPERGRMGWVFERDCVLSATEIFQVRQVPRLVFANACHSVKITDPALAVESDPNRQRHQQVCLAEAFFSRGIPNYIGTGWSVKDELARRFATVFYAKALGLKRSGEKPWELDAGPSTLGEALATAREAVLRDADELNDWSGWGAYQHYGHGNAILFSLPALDGARGGS